MRSSSPYHPHWASIFPFRQERIRTKETEFQRYERHATETFKQGNTPTVQRKSVLVRPSSSFVVSFVWLFYFSQAPQSGSGESEPEYSVPCVVGWSSVKRRCVEWPRPVARRNLRSRRAFSGDVMNCGVWMSPVVARWRIVRCVLSSWHSRRW